MSQRKKHHSHGRAWADEDDDYLCLHYPTTRPVPELAAHFGVTEDAIYARCRDMGLRRPFIDRTADAREAELRRQAMQDTSAIVAQAVASRTALEIAWGL